MAKRSESEFHATVVRREELSAHMVRVVLGGPGLRDWSWQGLTDSYLVLYFPPPDAPYAAPFSVEQVCNDYSPELWPHHRHYTVRWWDEEASEMAIDFVVHGDAGIAGPWAAQARVGDQIMVTLPGGGYRPDPSADWHLMVGDESAFPAIASALEVLAPGTRAIALLVCDDAEDHIALACPADLEVRWLHRRGVGTPEELLLDAVQELSFPDGRVHGFIHGEAGEIRQVRRHLLMDRGLDRADLSVSGYWRRTMTDESWRAVKRAWNAAVEADTEAANP